MSSLLDKIYLGEGCFWCMEAVFKAQPGVINVFSGYAGGATPNPSYEQVCTGKTGHAEVVEVEFDAKLTTLETLLDLFFKAHDPTTLNQQGADYGTQYRSIILCTSADQQKVVEAFIKKLTDEKKFADPIVTEVKLLDKFYKAEEYHQDYFAKNPNNAYCQVVINPKLNKLLNY